MKKTLSQRLVAIFRISQYKAENMLVSFVRKTCKYARDLIRLWASIILTIIAFYVMQYSFVNHKELFLAPLTVFNSLLAATILFAVDELLFPNIDTQKLLRENPIAYSLYILAFAIVIAVAFYASLAA
mgnify:CR=1 FL=1